MKHSLPKVSHSRRGTGRTVLRAVLASALLLASGRFLSAQAQETPRQPPDGTALVAQAARQLSQHPSLEAKIRQRVVLFDQYVVGSGHYVQFRHRDGIRFQLELRLQVGDQLSSLQQLNDGRYLWIRRDQGATQSLGRIDLQRVAAALRSADRYASLADPAALAIGGPAQLLWGLSESFTFGEPVPDEISNVPVWRIAGEWKRDALARLLPEQAESLAAGQPARTDQLPPHLPDHVALVVGRDPKVLPLFPYRVEFTRRDADAKATRPMLTMELFEVRFRPDLDPRQFTFQLGDQRVEDETRAYLTRLGVTETE